MSILKKSILFIYQKNIYRRVLLLFIDNLILFISIKYILQLSSFESNIQQNLHIYLLPVLFAIPIFVLTGQYSGITKFINSKDIYKLIIRQSIVLLLVLITSVLLNLNIYNFEFWISLFFITIFLLSLIRIVFRDFISSINLIRKDRKKRIAIYGAGALGAQIANYLNKFKNYKIEFFIDDDKSIWKRNINGIPIKSPEYLINNEYNIDEIVISFFSTNKKKLKEILLLFKDLKIPITKFNYNEKVNLERFNKEVIKPLIIEDLLGRDETSADENLAVEYIKGKTVLISGAGGSIGSELCRQIIKWEPKEIILLDMCELNLFVINNELRPINSNIQVKPILGDASDIDFVNYIFQRNKIDIVFHAAAYKHVPMLEYNPISAIKNNILSTKALSKAAVKANIDHFIQISTDKAVRPTNIMGATKRLSELIIQAEVENIKNSDNTKSKTLLSIVRFGNVLGSSGSVVPIFRKQIENGGPVLITHPDIIRYFMTIQEAVQLVLQVPLLSRGGEVFLLDMGEPVKIIDLAKQMIKLASYTIKDKDNPDGDIEIAITGLRPGEKLYEELLIDKNSFSTKNKNIFGANEEFIPYEKLSLELDKIEEALLNLDETLVKKLLSKLVPEWNDSGKNN